MPFYIAAVPGLVIALLVLTLPEPIRGSQEGYKVDATAPIDRPYRRILTCPTLWWIIFSGATVNFAAYAIGTFLPSLMIRYHHVNVAQAGIYPLSLVWENGGGDANCEWFTIDSAGVKQLINDSSSTVKG